MARTPRPVSRAESRAQTRERVLEAAEVLFLSAGYQATTVAQIAAKAGRTQGSIYGNFAGKEALGLEVLKRRYLQEFATLALSLGAGETLDEKLAVVTTWWEKLAGQQELTILVAEYMLATRQKPGQAGELAAYFTLLQSAIQGIVDEHFGFDDRVRDLTDQAAKAVVATGTGLALGQAAGLVDAHESSYLLTESIRMWAERFGELSAP